MNYEVLFDCRRGEEIFDGLEREKLQKDEDGWHLTGICLVAGLGPKDERDGSVEYYLSEPVVSDEEKGVGVFMMAYGEYLKLEKQDEKSRDVIEKGFVGAEQKLDALSQQVDADEEKVLEQLAVIVQQLTENAASSSTQLTQYQQNLQTEMENGKSDLTETAMQKYKVLLGVSLSFGIVNFLGVVALLIINLMP